MKIAPEEPENTVLRHPSTEGTDRADRPGGQVQEKNLSTMLRYELEQRGIRTIKAAAQLFGVSAELVRSILNRNSIPKDTTLLKIARAIGTDPSSIIRAAHRQKLPREMREFLLAPEAPSDDWKNKRRWPLSQEQCDYLGILMTTPEIQLIRKYRQFSPEEKVRAVGYIDYHFVTNRIPPPVQEDHPEAQ